MVLGGMSRKMYSTLAQKDIGGHVYRSKCIVQTSPQGAPVTETWRCHPCGVNFQVNGETGAFFAPCCGRPLWDVSAEDLAQMMAHTPIEP